MGRTKPEGGVRTLSSTLGGGGRYRSQCITEALEDALSEGTVAQTILTLPKNEANDLSFDLVSRVFLECMTNPEYGLDCYLSMRIRHGALSGQLRGPLEEQKVITQREGGSRQYKPNEFWLDKLTYPVSMERHELEALLARFSQDYDAIIEKFAGEFVQVRSTEKQGGLFSTAIPELYLGVIASDIKQDTSFDDFVTLCFDLFWRCVERDLKVVRNKIDTELKPAINSLFANLQSALAGRAASIQTQDLDRAISTAQTGAQNALNQVNEWFRLRKPESVPSLTLETIIDIGLKCVEKIHPDFHPRITQDVPSLPPLLVWTPLSDIFFIVFENIQKHSGIASPEVVISGNESNDQVQITIRSQVGDFVDISEARNRVAKIKDAILGGAYQRGARSEGGTGLMKLRKIIGKTTHLDFGFTSDTEFYVELEFPYREIPA